VCSLCYKSTKEKHHGFMKADQPPPKKRRFEAAADYHSGGAGQHGDDEEKSLPADVTCMLCRRKFSVGSFKPLNSRGPPAGGGIPYFPFLADLPRPDELVDAPETGDDRAARVRACQACATSLINQWTVFQREGVAPDERRYTYASQVTGPRSVSSIRAQSPLSQRSSGAMTPIKSAAAGVTQALQDVLGQAGLHRTRSNTVESRTRSNPHSPAPTPHRDRSISETIHPPQIASPALTATSVGTRATSAAVQPPSRAPSVQTVNIPPPACHSPSISVHSAASEPAPAAASSTAPPTASNPAPATTTTATQGTTTLATSACAKHGSSNVVATNASSFYCFLCGLHSELSFSRMLYSTPQGKKAPHFPFMKKHVPKSRAETLRDDGSALVCTFCYHSVMSQWSRYNQGGGERVLEPAARTYNINEYTCYVCGIQTYRKRIRALRVQDFPFIRQHKPKKGGLYLENGEMVAVCLDCYERLRSQFDEGEQYGIPVEQRQYNWIKIPPPPEDAPALLATPQERLMQQRQREQALQQEKRRSMAPASAGVTVATASAPAVRS